VIISPIDELPWVSVPFNNPMTGCFKSFAEEFCAEASGDAKPAIECEALACGSSSHMLFQRRQMPCQLQGKAVS
jgi:hypothetical protein